MLLAQDPKLLLVDEPVAGMTDAETEQTAELLKDIAKDHSVVVVEHDMAFVRALGVQGDRAARRLGAGGRLASTRSAPTSASSKSIWDDERMTTCSTIDSHRSVLRRRAGAARRLADGRDRARSPACSAATASARPSCCAPSSASSRSARGTHHCATAQDITALHAVRAGAARHRLRAAGPRDLPAADRARRTSRPASRRCRAATAHDPGRDLRAVPGAEDHAGPARRRPVRRPAAAARHRPRAGDAAAAARARRADRGHPALDHQGHRPRHRLPARARARWRSCWSSSISTSPASSPTISPSWSAARSC